MTTRDHPRSKPHGPRPAEVGGSWNLKNHWITSSVDSAKNFRIMLSVKLGFWLRLWTRVTAAHYNWQVCSNKICYNTSVLSDEQGKCAGLIRIVHEHSWAQCRPVSKNTLDSKRSKLRWITLNPEIGEFLFGF